MTTHLKTEKLKDFKNEAEFRLFIIDLLKKMGFQNVMHTHRYGNPELGKDIVGLIQHPIDPDEYHAFVVKHGRIGGGSNEIETIKAQVKQAFEYDYENINGTKIKINKVKVVTNENFTQGAQTSLHQSTDLRNYSNIDFWWNENLVEKIDKFYPDFWLPGDEFYKEYTKLVRTNIKEEFDLRDLSLRVEDKKIKKLIDLFVEPVMTESAVEEKPGEEKGELKPARKRVTISSLITSEENILLTGDPGSGKTKTLNNIILSILEKPEDNKTIPIKLKGKELKEEDFNISNLVRKKLEVCAPDSYAKMSVKDYKLVLFIDEIDVLSFSEKEKLFNNLVEYSKDGIRFFLTHRRNDNIDLEGGKTRSVRINNFSTKQVETFISMYFEGTERGEKFLQIIKESNLLGKLPTTPLVVTLLSLLYDENGYEIPATITDIFDDFTMILFGKLEIKNRQDLLILNIKKRLFTNLALKMLDSQTFEIPFDEFKNYINSFLESKGFMVQSDAELNELIHNSGILFIDDQDQVGFKQQAFIEYLASVEIYDHARKTHYRNLIDKFNDVVWQSTAIFFAGKSKDDPDLIQDLHDKLSNISNEELRDWFINSGGIGYLVQALYLTDKEYRKKLISTALENMVRAFYGLKELSGQEGQFFTDLPLPMIAGLLNMWFIENFKSVTLKTPLNELYDELSQQYADADVNDFDGDFKLFMIASTLMHKNVNDQGAFNRLIDRPSFIKNPVLMIAGDTFIEMPEVDKKKIDPEVSKKLDKQIKHHIKAIKHIVKEPAYRFNENYVLQKKEVNKE